jgi:hypothetical protein
MAVIVPRPASFKTIALFNGVVFLMFLGSMYALGVYAQGDWQSLGVAGYGYLVLGFLAFTAYGYYEFLTHFDRRMPRTFTKLAFALNIAAAIMLLLFLTSVVSRQ